MSLAERTYICKTLLKKPGTKTSALQFELANSGSASGNGSVWPLPELSARAPPVQRPKQALTQLLYGRRQAEKHCAPLRRSVHCSAAIACRCQRTSRKFLEQ